MQSISSRLNSLKQSGLTDSPENKENKENKDVSRVFKGKDFKIDTIPSIPLPPTPHDSPSPDLRPESPSSSSLNSPIKNKQINNLLKSLLINQKYEEYKKVKSIISEGGDLKEYGLFEKESKSKEGFNNSNGSKEGFNNSKEGSITINNDIIKIYKKHSKADSPSTTQTKQSLFLKFKLKALIASLNQTNSPNYSKLVFTIYNSSHKFISEEFSVLLTPNGMPVEEDLINKIECLFYCCLDFENLFFVCFIYKISSIKSSNYLPSSLSSSSCSSSCASVRKPFGIAVLNLTEIINTKSREDYLMRIYTPLSDSSFYSLLDSITTNNSKYESKDEFVCVGLDLQSTPASSPTSSNSSILLVDKFGLPDVVVPGYYRNTIYFTLVSGEFVQGRKSTAKNIQVCLYFNGSCFYESFVLYHCNYPKWNEVVKFDIPKDTPSGNNRESGTREGEIMVVVKHISTNGNSECFGIGFLSLFCDDGIVIQDSEHTITLYKYDEKLKQSGSSLNELPLKDKVIIKSELCSTQMTQNSILMKLLNWNGLVKSGLDELKIVLKEFTFIGHGEIIKYLQDIFNTLFELIVWSQTTYTSNNGDSSEIQKLVFSALVFILNIIINDKKFSNFKSILDVYIHKHFCSKVESLSSKDSTSTSTKDNTCDNGVIWKCLFKCLCKLIEDSFSDFRLGKDVRSMLKCVDYLVLFCVNSWRVENGVKDDIVFREWCFLVFEKLGILFRGQSNRSSTIYTLNTIPTTPSTPSASTNNLSLSNSLSCDAIGAQIIILSNFSIVLNELLNTNIFSLSELVSVCVQFIECELNNDKKKVLEKKLFFILQVLGVLIGDGNDEKETHGKKDLNQDKDLGVLFASISKFLKFIYSNSVSPDLTQTINKIIMQIVESKQLKLFTKSGFDDVFGLAVDEYLQRSGDVETSVCFLSVFDELQEEVLVDFIVSSCNGLSFDKYFKLLTVWLNTSDASHASSNTPSGKRASDRFSKDSFFQSFETTLDRKTPILDRNTIGPFPDTWTQIIKKFYFVCLKAIKCLCSVLTKENVWVCNGLDLVGCFVCLIKLCNENTNDLEFLKKFYLDCVGLLESIWVNLKKDSNYILLVGYFVELSCLFKSELVQTFALSVLVEMISQDFTESINSSSTNFIDVAKSLTPIQVEFIGQLDKIIMNGKSFESTQYKTFLVTNLSKKLPAKLFENFIKSVDQFLSLLLYTKSLQFSLSLEEDDELLSLLFSQLIHFTAVLDRKEMYVKYIHCLFSLHFRKGDFVEAAFTLKLHADLFDFSENENDDLVEFGEDLTGLIGTEDGLLTREKLKTLKTKSTEFEKKETLLLICVALFIKAKYYEKAIEILKLLSEKYESLYDYDKLSKCHKQISETCLKIKQDRFYPSYFRVAFVGEGWADLDQKLDLYGRHFIQKGKELESLAEFIDRTLSKFDSSEVLILKQSNFPPDECYIKSKEKYLQICKVDPISTFDVNCNAKSKMYFENNWISKFSFSRPFKSTKHSCLFDQFKEKSAERELLSLWAESYTLEIENEFPFFLKVSKVVSCERVEFSPLENAIMMVENKNKELEKLEKEYKVYVDSNETYNESSSMVRKKSFHRSSKRMSTFSNTNSSNSTSPSVNVNPLTMSLNGAIDAPVNGGIPMYKRVFLNEVYINTYPHDKPLIDKLNETIDQQVIHRLLPLHGLLVSDMKPLHEQLISKIMRKS